MASRKVHAVDPSCPEEVRVISNADAGEVFYRRSTAGEVVHLDIFHEVGEVNHCLVARAILEALRGHPLSQGIIDYIDVQTATGGGRLTGSLNYGDKPSLRRAHLNHVHVAALLDDDRLALLFLIVSAVEAEILAQGYEIRRIERVVHERSSRKGKSDLSPYQSFSDSMIQGDGGREEGSRVLEQQANLQKAMELSDDFGSVDEVAEVLDYLAEESDLHQLMARLAHKSSSPSELVDLLVNKGLVRRDGWKAVLTAEGWRLRNFIRTHRREIEMQFRRLVRKIPAIAAPREKIRYATRASSRPGGRLLKKIVEPDEDEWLTNIAVSETVLKAAKRRFAEATSRAGVGPRFLIDPEDIMIERRMRSNPVDICLLIDASASMAGRRIHAAKYLARHLLLSTRDRVAVIVFQESGVKIHVPFTRAYQKIESGVLRIQPLGLTPLAEGIIGCLEYIRSSRVKNPLLLLITDGIPTVPKWTLNPIDDALEAAGRIAETRVRFGCVGLDPNKTFLEGLVKRAGGTLYIVDELEKDTLATIAHRERGRK